MCVCGAEVEAGHGLRVVVTSRTRDCFLGHSCGVWRGVCAVLSHGCDVEDIIECVVPGRAANPSDGTLCRGEEGGEVEHYYTNLL